MNYSICSFNVRGLGQIKKRRNVFNFLEKNNFDICFLQETHSKLEVEPLWTRESNQHMYFSGRSSASGGVCFIVKRSLHFNLIYHKEIIPGKIQALKLNIDDKDIVFLNIYGPNNDDAAFFETLYDFLGENDEEQFIIGGDFNTVLDSNLDKFGGIEGSHKKCREKLLTVMENFDLSDVWRSHNPNLRQYTWHSSSKPVIFSRLDYFLVSDCFSNQVSNCKIKPGFMSDHSIISICLNLNTIERGKGYFKINNSLILQPEYQEMIRTVIGEVAETNKDANPNTLWEVIKGNIRNESIKYASYKKKERNNRENQLIEEINLIKGKLTKQSEIDQANELLRLKEKNQELQNLYEQDIKGYIIRAKAEYIEGGEKNSKYFANLEKKRSEAKTLHRLVTERNEITNQKEILEEVRRFYEKMYNKQDVDNNRMDQMIKNISAKLSEEDKNSIEGHLNEYECACALRDMNNNKSPGSDGITTEFYKIFWNDVKSFYVKSLNYSFENGSLTTLQKQGIISLLPKKDKNLESLKNWRPLTLLNTDYKIATKAIANRIKKFLHNIIDCSQTGFIKGRYIGENVRLIQETIEKLNNENQPGLLFFADFEKAFDSVSHEYILKCLKSFNFGTDIIKWVECFYKGATSCVLNAGCMSDFFAINRGVRQGCTLSPYLFILCIEILSATLINDQDITGIKINGKEFKTTMFADDATFAMDGSLKSFKKLISILADFKLISGLKLNINKTIVLKIGSLKYTDVHHLSNMKFEWTSESAKTLEKYSLMKNIN